MLTNEDLPINAVIMAGGKGIRLRPLTYKSPKPMLEIGEKPMLAYNIEKLLASGIKNIYISVNYLKEQIINYVNNNYSDFNIKFIEEDKPLGTIGAISLVNDWKHEDILVINADIISNINFKNFYISHKNHCADISLATFNKKIQIPYGVLENISENEYKLKEKPIIEYCAVAGIYLFKKTIIKYIPYNEKYDAPNLISSAIKDKVRINKFSIDDYWLDIGTKQTYDEAKKNGLPTIYPDA